MEMSFVARQLGTVTSQAPTFPSSSTPNPRPVRIDRIFRELTPAPSLPAMVRGAVRIRMAAGGAEPTSWSRPATRASGHISRICLPPGG
jgi:hypothetical protein